METQTQTPTEPTGAAPAQSPPPENDRLRELEIEKARLEERLNFEARLREESEQRYNVQFRPVQQPEPPREEPFPENFALWEDADKAKYIEDRAYMRAKQDFDKRLNEVAQPYGQQMAQMHQRNLEADVVRGLEPAEAEIALQYLRDNIRKNPGLLANGYTPEFAEGVQNIGIGLAAKKARAAKPVEPPAGVANAGLSPFDVWLKDTYRAVEGKEMPQEVLEEWRKDPNLRSDFNSLRTH